MTLNAMAKRWKREMESAPICEPGRGERIDACHWSRTGWAIWNVGGGCTCRPANEPKKVSLQDALKVSLKDFR